ncbi:MAG TPA: hypothetical protein DEQ38_03295 [Elusimicrobia bacterium]|nr:MAG: hypothetical protein A2089_02090 [Elusimicrobia bacterium GWD2_63_28]HCC47129.1 hypothetical protein [Elusimicrobiota bacterium]
MSKIKNIFINLLGAAVIAACSASTALAQWSTADYGGKNVTGEVFADRNSVSFLPAPGGNANVVWTNYLTPLTFGIAAQQLANSDGSYVWVSTAAVAAGVTMGENTGPDASEANPDGAGGLLVKYVDEVSSNCYITDMDSSGALRPGWTLNPVLINSDPVVGCNMVPVLGGEAFGFVMISTAVEGELPGSFIRAFNLNDGTVLAPFSSGNGVAVGTAPYIAVPSPAGAGQTYPGAIFLNISDDQQTFTAFRVDSQGAINWSVVYSTTANTNNVSLLPDGASGAYIVWSDIVTQHIRAIRINASGVQYPAWDYTLYTTPYLNSNYGMSGDNGAWYSLSTASGVVVAWAEDVATNAEIRVALLKADGSGIAWNTAVDTLLQGTGLSMDGSNLTISSNTAGAVAIAYQYGSEFKALNAAVLNSDGQTLVAGHAVMSGFPSDVSNHDAFAVDANNDFIVGVMISSSIYAQKITVPAAPVGAGFTGSFALPEGASFDGGNYDAPAASVFYDNSLYVVGVTSPTGGFIVRYNATGSTVLSSATMAGVAFNGLAVNTNGVYVVGSDATRIFVAKYTPALGFVASNTAGYSLSEGAAIALSAAGNVFVAGSDLSTGDYHIAMFDSGLVAATSENGFASALTTHKDTASGLAVDGDNVYLAGHSLISNTTYFVLAKFSEAGYLSSYSSSSISGVYLDAVHPVGGRIAVNPLTHDIYAALNGSHTEMKLARFSQDLANLGTQPFAGVSYAAAADVVIDSTGSVLMTGSYNPGTGDDYPVLLKYSPTLVFLSSAASVQTYGYEASGLALDPFTGYSYVTGVYFSDGLGTEPGFDMRTVRFAPLAGGAGPAMRQISGTVTYAGTFSSPLTIWVSTSPDFRGTPYFVNYPVPASPQVYTIPNVPAGVYYMAMTASDAWPLAAVTDPWGVYGQLGTPQPIDVVSADATGIDVAMIDGNQIPNPWSTEAQSASVICAADFASGGDCRINGNTTFATALAADADDNKYLLLTNLTDSAIVKFNNFGVDVASVVVKYATFNDLKFNTYNGDLYVAAQGAISGIRLFRYTSGLALVSTYTVAGYQGARQLDFDAQGNVYAVSTVDNSGDYDIRVVKVSEDFAPLEDWSDLNAGPDQGYGIDVDGTDVFVTGIVTDAVNLIRLDATSGLTKADWQDTGTVYPIVFPEGEGFNNIRVAADSSWVYAAFSTLVETSTRTAIFRFDRANLASFSSANMAGADHFGDLKIDGLNLYVAAQSDMNQARVTKYAAESFEPVASSLASVPMPYGMAPGALAFGVAGTAAEVYLAGVIPDGLGGLSGGVGAISAVNGPVPEEYIEGTDQLKLVADGAGGSYMVWDSTVAPGGLRMIYAKHTGGTEWSQAVTLSPVDTRDIYALPDGVGGLYVGWFAGGQAYAQRYGSGGTAMFGASGVQVSTGPVDGGEFIANPAGGLFAIFGYIQTETDISLVAQSVDASGSCLWPSGTCATSQGVAIPAVNFAGEGAGTYGADGSFLFFWGGDTEQPTPDGFLQINGVKITAAGTIDWGPASLEASVAQLGYDLETAPDGAGGAYVMWSSSAAAARTLYAQRYDGATGAAASGWTTPVQLTAADLPASEHLNLALAADDEGFSVMYSTSSMFGSTEVRIVRALADGTGLAPAFALGGKLLGYTSDGEQNFVYDPAASAYHIAFNPWATGLPEGNYHQVGYQKMSKAGDFLFNPYYEVGLSSDCLKIDVSTDGAGGALVGWIEKSGGDSLPRLLNIPAGTGSSVPSFTGDFSSATGSGFDYAGNELGMDVAFYGGNIYAVGGSESTGGLVIKYDSAGVMVSSIGLSGMYAMGVAVNANGVYVAAQGEGTGFVTAKYSHDLVVSSVAVLPGDSSAREIALDAAGNVYVIGSNWGEGAGNDYKVAKYDAALQQLVPAATFDAGGFDEGRGIAVDNGYVYVTGTSYLFEGATSYALAKLDADTLVWVSSAAFANAYAESPALNRLAVNPVTHDVYMAGTVGTESYRQLATVRYSADLNPLGADVFANQPYGLGTDVKLDADGNVYALGKYYDGSRDLAFVAKYTPNLVFLSSAGNSGTFSSFTGFALDVDPATGYSYVTGGLRDGSVEDMATMRFAPMSGGMAPAGAFSGDFTTAAVYSGPDYDYATSLAVNPANGDAYVTIVSSVAGNDQGLVVRYTASGGMSSSATLTGANGFSVGGVALNANGIYVSGAASGDGALLRYDADLGLVSSTTLAGVYDPGVVLDASDNVYLVGSGAAGWTLARYAADLAFSSSNTANTALTFGAEVLQTRVWDLAADNGYIYAVGENWLASSAYYLTAKFDAATLAFISSATYANESGELEVNAGIAVNANTHDVYVGLTGGTPGDRRTATLRYSQDLSLLGQALYDGDSFEMGHDVLVAPDGYVYTLGKNYNGTFDHTMVLKYSPSLVFLSRADSVLPDLHTEGSSLGLYPTTGNFYVAGLQNTGGGGAQDPTSDAATVLLAPISGTLPVVYISSADVSPAFYLAGQEAAALKLVPYTLTGEVGISGLYIDVNPGSTYYNIASVGLYSDYNQSGIWDMGDELISSGTVTGAAHLFDFSGLNAVIGTAQEAIFVTLTPAITAEGSDISVSVPSSGSFVTQGDMAQQAIYPIAAQPKLVNYLAALSDLVTDAGASLEAVNLYWTYPQDIASGHYIIRYSTNPADLTDPNVFNAKTTTEAVSGVIANSAGFAPLSGIPLVTSGLRVFPQYFAVWLYNGTSTSSVSNLAQNLYFPAMTATDGDAALNRRRGMYAGFEAGAKFARVSGEAGAYSALTFNSESLTFLALNAPDGSTRFYYDQTTPLALKDLAADPAGNAYALLQRDTEVAAAKFAPDGSVAWNTVLSPSAETAKAITWGGGAVYIATEFENGANSQDLHLYKRQDSNGNPVTDFIYDTAYLYGAGSYDEVNSLVFASDTSGAYLYAAGVSGTSQMAGTLHKFADSGAVISTVSTGNWPVRHSNPSGDYSRALAVKADLNGNLLVAGSEQRYDLNQGANIWLNKFNAYGASLFSVPARYNNQQSNGDDVPSSLDFDQFGNIYASGYTDMWNLGQGYNMLLAKFGPGGQFQSARVYDGGGYDMGMGVMVSTDNFAHVAGSFGGDNYFGVYSMPIGGAVANVQFFNAMEGPHTGSVDLLWNYTGQLPAGSTYYVQYSADAAPVWNKASAQIIAAAGPEFAGAVRSHRVGALPTLRYPGQEGTENRGNLYKFKVWITSAGLTTELPEAQTFARTPSAYDDTRYFGLERLSFMSGLSMPPNAITVDGAYVYHAFSGRADGANAGFGLRKYNTGQYLEWTKFFNHRDDRSYQVGTSTRDAAGNFYIVGTQYPYNNIVTGPEIMVAGKDSWIAKLNPAGDLVWSYAYDVSGLGTMDELYGAAVEGDYLYVAGASSTSANGMAVLAMKYDLRPSTGPSQVWSYTLNGSVLGDDFGYGVAVGTGAVYFSGTLQNATKDAIVIALNKTDGSLAGAPIQLNDPALNEEAYALAITTTTPPYLYLGGSVGGLGGSAYEDGALFKYTLAGVHEWTQTFDGKDGLNDEFYALEANGSGVIVAGYTQTGPEGKNSIFRKYTHEGQVAWTRGFNLVDDGDPYTTNPGDDEVYGLALGGDGRVYAAVALWGNNPGFYYFPEPNFGVTAQPGYVPSSVRLQWMSRMNLQAGSAFLVQYSTFSGVAWSSAAAQVRLVTDYDIYEGMSVDRSVFGLNTGRDMAGTPLGPLYYFKIWAEPYMQALIASAPPAGGAAPAPVKAGALPAELVSDVPAAARAADGWAFETMAMYPNEAKLFVMGTGQQFSGEKEFPGIARDGLGNIYTLANTDWNGSGGFALKKFNSAFMPLLTRYYSPGEWYQVKANRMAVDASGLYLTGYEWNTSGSTGKDLFVMKVDADGVAWKSTFNLADGDDVGYGVALDRFNNVYVAGAAFNGTSSDALVAKFSPAGVLLSTVTYDGSAGGADAAYGIAVEGLNVYAAGTSEETGKASQLWAGRFLSLGLSQISVINDGLDDAGAYSESAYDVAVDSLGYVYIAGQTYDGEGSVDAILYKSSANFVAAWAEPAEYGSQANGVDAAHGIAIGPAGSVYLAGYSERYDINQDKNLWLRRYAPDGTQLGEQEFHANAITGPNIYDYGPSADEGYSMVVDPAGYISVSGRFSGLSGVYRYKQVSTLVVNPRLTVNVSSAAAGTPFPGVAVTLIPFSATGGIDVLGSSSSVTNAAGTVSFQVPAGKQYFIALDKQGYNPSIKDQQMDPYGNFFVQLNADVTKNYTLSPRPAATPYYPVTVMVSSAAQNDYLVAEVFFTQTGEKAAYGIGRVPAGVTATTMTITNLPPAAAGAYTLGITIPNRGLAKSAVMSYVFPATATYSVSMSTLAGAVATTGGFDVGASTTPPSVEGVVKNFRTWAPIEQVRVRLYNRQEPCSGGMCEYNSFETLTDVNGKFSFYNVTSTAAVYNIIAQKAGYKRAGFADVSVTTASVQTAYREFQLQEATYTLRGYIRYRDVPVPNAEVMVWGDYDWYGGSDSYKNGYGMDTDARTRTAADGSFVFSTATANGLPDGQVRMNAAFFGNWMDLNEGNTKDFTQRDADDVRIVISSAGATGVPNSNCAKGRAWKLNAQTGACQSLASGEISFNIMPPSQNDYAVMSGSVTFVTSFTVTTANPLIISTMAPITVMAQQECSGDCSGNMSMGFAVISGTYTVNYATYSITLSTGVSYYTRVTSNEWGEVSSFKDRADFRSTMTTSVRMNFVVTKAGRLTGVVKMPDGSNYKPNYTQDQALYHRMDINVSGQNVSVSEGWNVDDYGAFEFPNLAPGLYTITMRPQGQGFRWAAPVVRDIAVVAGKTTQVTLKLENGLYVQPQIIGLPDISTPTWHYVMLPVPTGTEMNQTKITDMFFGEDIFAFDYSTTTQTWDKKIMQVGQYDFYLMMVARYSPEGGGSDPISFDQFSNFIGKVKAYNVQRNDSTPNLGTEFQPLPVNVLGSLGQDTFEGTIAGERLYTDADLDRIFSNMEELFPVIPSVMIYDAAGDLRGYTAGMPSEGDFPAFWAALGLKDKVQMRDYFEANLGRFMVPGLPPGRYTVVFNNPNYPPVAKEIDIPLAAAYPFDFDEQNIRVGTVHGTVRSTAPVSGAYPALDNAVVYLRHKTVEKFTETAADGSFRFENLPAGIYRLEVTREGFVKAGEKTSLAGDDSSRLDFYLTPSQTSMTGKVYLGKFPAPLTKSGVKVVAYDETFNVEHPTEYLPKIEATTNDSGEYELPGVVPGHNYKVTAFFGGKQPAMLDVSSETVTEGVTYLPDIVLRDVPPQIVVKVRRSPDSVNKADVTIKSPKALVTTPVCKVNPGEVYVTTSAVSLALVPGPNNTYQGQFIISMHQPFYNVYVAAGDGSNRMEKSVTFSPNNQAKTEQYIQDEAIQGGEVQMDKESEEYSGIELDTGGLAYSTYSATASSDFGNLVGGFFSALPSVRTVKTAKGDLSLTQAITDLMASEIYNMELQNASANKAFTLTLKYDKDKAVDNANLRIYQYDETTDSWNEVPGNYTTDPMLGVLSVGVASLSNASAGASAASTPLGRKRMGMSAVVNGRYVPSATSSSSSGRFAVFTARPAPSVPYASADYEVANLPNPFNLKDKTVTNIEGTAAFSGANSYTTRGTLIKYHLPTGKSGSVKFVIYNLAGEKVRTISDGVRAGGQMYYSEWDGKNDTNQDVASGVYFMLTYVGGEKLGTKAHKLAVIK